MPTILVVDDEKRILELLQIRLESEGYDVVTAKHGEEGLEKVRAYKPNMIICDVLMPVMDGYAFYKELKKDRATAKIPVLILTARANMKETFAIAGADEFLAKPADPSDLIEKVSKLLSHPSY